MKTLFLPLFFLIIFSSPAFCEADPGLMWLEQMGRGHVTTCEISPEGWYLQKSYRLPETTNRTL